MPVGIRHKQLASPRRDGSIATCHPKVVLHGNGLATWEIRRIGAFLHPQRKGFDTGKIVRSAKPLWSGILDVYGLVIDNHVIPNHDSLRGGAHPMACYVGEQFSITTWSLLALLVALSGFQAAEADGAECPQLVLLEMLLQDLLGVDAVRGVVEAAMADAIWAPSASMCSAFSLQAGRCSHVDVATQHVPDYGSFPQLGLIRWLHVLFAGAGGCFAMKLMLQAATHSLQVAVSDALASSTWDNDPLTIPNLPGGGRKNRRVDEDKRQAMLDGCLIEGKAPTVGALARATGHVPESTARSFSNKALYALHAALRRDAMRHDMECISMSVDGKKLGQPLEETEVYVCVDMTANVAYVPPIMASLNS